MKRKVLFIVPHPDDELYVGGAALYEFARSKDWIVKVVFTTNGDFIADLALKRMCEAIKALKIVGVKKENIIFLGYGDGWQNLKHIYNERPDNVIKSVAGHDRTHDSRAHDEYSYIKYSIHRLYTRNNYKEDIKNCILDIMPDVLISVGLDSHPDHRAVSLFIDECMCEILKNYPDYLPLMLKKFSYSGVWKGLDDYYTWPHRETLNASGERTDDPSLQWKDRLRFQVHKKCNTLLIYNNKLYRAVKKHRTQNGWLSGPRFINDDIVFWQRRTDNLALHARITASSGVTEYLNDFKRCDSTDINQPDILWNASVWMPDENDSNKIITCEFVKKINIQYISLYENPKRNAGHIKDIEIRMDNGNTFFTGELIHGGCENRIYIQNGRGIKRLEFRISNGEKNCGLSEIEIYDNYIPLENYNLPVKNYEETGIEKANSYLRKCITIFGRKMYHLQARIFFAFYK